MRLNCLTSVQFLEPLSGSVISRSLIKLPKPSMSPSFMASARSLSTLSISTCLSIHLWLVSLNIFSSKVGPNFSFALSTSFWILASIFSAYPSINWSALYLFLESLLSTNGSLNASTCPEAFQVLGCMKMAASIPTMFWCICTILFHQYCLILVFNSEPYGP